MTTYPDNIVYFADEGRAHLNDCLHRSFSAAVSYGIEKIVIFTARGDGIHLAIQRLEEDPDCKEIKIVGVSFPHGQTFTDPKEPSKQIQVEITSESRQIFEKAKVPIVRARLPFDSIAARFRDHGVLGQDFSLIGNALSIFGGGMSLCVQAALMACDAGEVIWGEHIIAMTADTSILVQAAPTSRFLTDFVVREILCKPIFLTIAKKETVPTAFAERPASDQDDAAAKPDQEHLALGEGE
jgi:hypothetical protein